VNGIIVPFRSGKSSKLYQELWTENGSPLLYISENLKEKLQKALPEEYAVFLAMRYGKPSLKETLENILDGDFQEVIVLPLYPQYASSTTETVTDFVKKGIKKRNNLPDFKFIDQFYDDPGFLNSFAEQIKKCDYKSYDHILFSYHGLPLSHIKRIHPKIDLDACNCEKELPKHGAYCYKATCYETTRLLANQLQIPKEKYSVGFQSRLSKNWLTPFADELVVKLAKQGKKKLLVVAPSFVTDCLETIIEIGQEYKDLFVENGGEKLTLVESLNDSGFWIQSLKEMITQKQLQSQELNTCPAQKDGCSGNSMHKTF
jgi:ferrochelatase